VSDDALKAPDEAVVFTAVAAWVSDRKSERVQHSDALLAHVRFALIDAACLAEVVECHPLMQTARGKVSAYFVYYYTLLYAVQATTVLAWSLCKVSALAVCRCCSSVMHAVLLSSVR
jgi:BTB And C-terminal Kelch